MASRTETDLQSLEASRLICHELAEAIRQGCDAVTKMDLDGIYRSVSNQETLAARLRALDEERREAKETRDLSAAPRESVDSALSSERIRSAESDLATARKEVERWNRVQKVLLERSARNIHLLANTLVSFFATYPSPYSQTTTATSGQ